MLSFIPPNQAVVMIAARFLEWNLVTLGKHFAVLTIILPSKVMLSITITWNTFGYKIRSKIASPLNVEDGVFFNIRTNNAILLANTIKTKCAPAISGPLKARFCLIYMEIDFHILVETVCHYIESTLKFKCTELLRIGRTWFLTFTNHSKLSLQICLEIILVEYRKRFSTVPTGSSKLTKYDGKVDVCGSNVSDLIHRTATAARNVITACGSGDDSTLQFHSTVRSIITIKISKTVTETQATATYRIYMMLADIMAADIHNIAKFENPINIIAKFTFLENGKFSRREIKVFLQSLQTIYGESCVTFKNI